MFLDFVAQVRHLGGIGLLARDRVSRQDVVLAGVTGNVQHLVRIELLVRHRAGHAPFARFLFLPAPFLGLALARFFLLALLLPAHAHFLVRLRLAQPLALVVLRLFLQPLLLFFLGALLLRALRDGAPHGLRRFVAAGLAQVARGLDARAAHPALV